jgi:hypothetical protein
MDTLKADNRSRVKLPQVKPGTVFALESPGEGQFLLTLVKKIEPRPVKARLVKRNGHLVAVADRPPNMDVVNQLLKELP